MPIILLLLSVLWVVAALLRRRMPPLSGEIGRVAEALPVMQTGLIVGAFFAVLTVIMLIRQDAQAPFCAVFTLLCAFMVHMGCMPCLRWHEEGFSLRNMLGLTHGFTWQDEMWLTEDELEFVLHTRHGSFSLLRGRPEHLAFLSFVKAHRPLELRSRAGLKRRR